MALNSNYFKFLSNNIYMYKYVKRSNKKNVNDCYSVNKGYAVGGFIGQALDWLLGETTTRFKNFLKDHGNEAITSLAVGRTPISSVLDLAAEIMTAGKYGEIKNKAGYDSFFHLYVIINNKYIIEKTQTVDNRNYAPSQEEEKKVLKVPNCTIDEFVKKGAAGNLKKFWSQYQALKNNCQDWVINILSKNHVLTPEASSFIKQDLTSLIKEVGEKSESIDDVTDVASLLNRFLQKVSGGAIGFAVGVDDLTDPNTILVQRKRHKRIRRRGVKVH
jgi:hypothetical protein